MNEGDGLRDALAASLGPAFRITSELGGGDLARVFAARDVQLERDVVVKVLPLESTSGISMERFAREIRLAATLQDPHIVPIYSAGATADGLTFYIAAHVRGESLRARMRGERVPISQAVIILRDMARALAYAHRQGVIHRDIKPENVLLSYGTTLVADFGVAKAVVAARGRPSGGDTPTPAREPQGTPAYMAPEQAAGGEVDARSDLYSLGVVAYELLSGAHPFAGHRTSQQYIAAHLTETPVHLILKLPDAPLALCELVMRCLDKDPAQRPIAATELARVLDDAELNSAPRLLEAEESVARSPRLAYATRIVASVFVALLTLVVPAWIARYRVSKPVPSSADFARDGTPLSTVAILPFANAGGDARTEYLANGMTQELSHALARLPGIRVAGSTSSRAYPNRSANPLETGKALNVGGLVTGSVQRDGNRVRVSAQLVNANDGVVVWSEHFDKPADALFAVQDEVTKRIIDGIAPGLSVEAASAAARLSRGTASADAYDVFLRGRTYLSKGGTESTALAADAFRKAIARDPQFARAYAYMAMSYAQLARGTGIPGDSVVASALTPATRALSMDSTLAEAHLATAMALSTLMRYAEAEQHFTRAVRGMPGDALTRQRHAENLAALGRLTGAADEMQVAADLDPLSADVHQSLMGIEIAANRFDDALAESQRIAKIDSTLVVPRILTAMVLANSGRADSAVHALESLARTQPYVPGVRGARAFAYAAMQRWTDAVRVRADILDRRPRPDYDVFLSSIVFGDLRRALDILEQSTKRTSDLTSLTWSLSCDPAFEPLRKEPRFIAFANTHGMTVCPSTGSWPIAPRASRAHRPQ